MQKNENKIRILKESDILPFFVNNVGKEEVLAPDITLKQILMKFADNDEITKMVLEACEKLKSNNLEIKCARTINDRQYSIDKFDPNIYLKMKLCPRVTSITIPDPSKDEIEAFIEIETGSDANELLQHMARNEYIENNAIDTIHKRWLKSSFSINSTDVDQALEKSIKMMVDNCSSERTLLTYNISEVDCIWRREIQKVKMPMQLEYNRYPFDKQTICIDIGPAETCDVTSMHLEIGQETNDDEWLKKMILPRGFSLYKYKFLLYSEYSDGYYPTYNIKMIFEIVRKPDTFVWRTFIPTMVIVLLAALATFVAQFTNISVEAVRTNLLPASLIASVALQLIAAQNVPKNSGKTYEDVLFIFVYLIIISDYVILQFASSIYTTIVNILIFSFFVTLATIFLKKTKKYKKIKYKKNKMVI
jgi:hypothetical protein